MECGGKGGGEMKKSILFLLLSGLLSAGKAEAQEHLVMFWNVENFFDYINEGTGESDAEFSSWGERHWTKARFNAKCDAIAKMLLWVGDKYGEVPPVVGFAEVENFRAMRSLVSNTILRKFGYRVVHYESPDHRGIDVALIYRPAVYELLSAKPCHIYKGDGSVMHTRDILLVSLREREGGDTTFYAVNHHPSKYGGEAVSRPSRLAAMTRLKEVCDSVLVLTKGRRVITMGDFNDTPDNELFGIFGSTMVNKSRPLFKKGRGTIKYNGKWELIDMFIISAELEERYGMEIIMAPFHVQDDRAHVGVKPFRTYSGPRYIGGISDHFPIVLRPLR